MKTDSRYIAVEDHDNLVKDTTTNSVLNADYDGFQAFKSKKEREKQVDERLNILDDKLSEIFSMLHKLTEDKK